MKFEVFYIGHFKNKIKGKFLNLLLDTFFRKLICFGFLPFAEGQPESIVEDIENMVRSYVEKVRISESALTKTLNQFLQLRLIYLFWL